ncbi:hypothetical protein MSAN_00463100 [Mycena sanguinolenta]|uniref:Uncharacterized protein n=1 Tax=Mycena sanguinolenta TaxID=230812 RepID=A0A8H6ZAY2_9AGAR|nr:hypothetical protein MSAN_00463100 [Mycena sanguinolenta]
MAGSAGLVYGFSRVPCFPSPTDFVLSQYTSPSSPFLGCHRSLATSFREFPAPATSRLLAAALSLSAFDDSSQCTDCDFDDREENDAFVGFDKIDRGSLEAPPMGQNKGGVYQCKKHGGAGRVGRRAASSLRLLPSHWESAGRCGLDVTAMFACSAGCTMVARALLLLRTDSLPVPSSSSPNSGAEM